jgi:hypothetical protein
MSDVFPDQIRLNDLGIIKGTRVYELESDFRFFSSKGLITVPKGFHTDGYSVPAFLHSFCNPMAKGMESSLGHDFLYNLQSKHNFTRKEVDDLFLEGMKACGVGFMKRSIIYSAVRSFGWRFFKKK